MTKQNDISNLFRGIGMDSSSYKELAAEREVDASLERWSLLASVHKQRTGREPKANKPQEAGLATPVEQVVQAAPVEPTAGPQEGTSVGGVFQRISQKETAQRQEPTVSSTAWETAPELTPEVQPAPGVQSLFARLAQQAQSDTEPAPLASGSSIFERLMKK